MRLFIAGLVLLAFTTPALADVDLDSLRASVVSIEVTVQPYDYNEPWQSPRPGGSGGSGFFIGERRLMTNAHVVSDTKIIRVKRPDRPEKYPARILFIAHDCDLAIITVDEQDFFDGMVPMEFGDIPALRSQVTAVGYPIGGRKLSITEGVVSRIELTGYVQTGADRHLAIQIDAAINPGNSGGPVVQGNKVVGVAFQTQFFSQNIGYMIPVPVIRHFLKDVEDGKYDGYANLGIITTSLENDGLREWLGVPEGETGVLVLKALPHSSSEGLVKPNDVLHAVDNVKIENDGTVKVGDEYLELAFIVQEKHVGDTLTLKIRRDGKPIDVPVTLKTWDVEMPLGTAYDTKPEYLVIGGYVFLPVSANYVARMGWRTDLRYWLQEYYTSIIDTRPGVEELVVLSRVLRHDSTRYRSYNNVIVNTVNGKAPRDFADFVRMLENTEDRAVLTFEGVNIEPLVLDRKHMEEVQEEILQAYGITESRHVREED
jgi:S1-C subfamily serine protease